MNLELLEPRKLFSVSVSEGYPGYFEVTGDGAVRGVVGRREAAPQPLVFRTGAHTALSTPTLHLIQLRRHRPVAH